MTVSRTVRLCADSLNVRLPFSQSPLRSAFLRTFPLALALFASALAAKGQSVSNSDDTVKLAAVSVTEDKGAPFVLGLEAKPATASRLGLANKDIPAAVEILDGAALRERGDASLVEAVTRTTGVINLGAPGNGGTSVGARGFVGHGAVMQLFDGTRFYVGSGTVTFPFDPWMVDRVEVLHGPASVLWGDAATGGAVNYVPRQPGDVFVSNARFAYGSDDSLTAALGAGGPLSRSVSYRADVSYRRSDTWLSNNDTESLSFAGSLRWVVSPALSFTLSYDYGDREPSRYFGTPLIDGKLDEALRHTNFNVGDSVIKYRDRWTRLKASWRPGTVVEANNQLYYLTSKRHWKDSETYTWNPTTRLLSRGDYLEILHDQKQVGDRFDLLFHGGLFDKKNDLLVGADANYIDFRHTNNSPYGGSSVVDPYAFDPGYFTSPVATSLGLKTRTSQGSVFAEDRLALSPSWALVGGARYDYVDLKRTDLRTPANSFKHSYGYANWRVGAVFSATKTLSLYGQFSTAADPVGGSLITTSAAQKDWDLTKSRQFELGLKQAFWGKRGEWSLAAYHLRKKNLLMPDPADITKTVQVGRQSTQGIEAAVAIDLGAGLRLATNAAWLHARYDDFSEKVGGALVSREGNRPVNVPAFASNADLQWSFLPGWDAAAGLRYVGRRFSNTANSLVVGDYAVFDLRLRHRLTRQASLYGRLSNVFDRLYATSTSNSGSQWMLGAPRALEVGVDLSF